MDPDTCITNTGTDLKCHYGRGGGDILYPVQTWAAVKSLLGLNGFPPPPPHHDIFVQGVSVYYLYRSITFLDKAVTKGSPSIP